MSIRPLNPELRSKAINNLNEDPASLEENLQRLRIWIEERTHWNFRKDDQWLVTFLRGSKHNLEKAKMKLEQFYVSRLEVPEVFADRDPFSPEIQELLNSGVFLPLPKTATEGGPRIILVRFENLGNVRYANLLKTFMMIFDILMHEDDNLTIGGIQTIMDLSDMTFKHVLLGRVNTFRKFMMCLYRGYPISPKGVYLINPPYFARFLIYLLKQTGRKMEDRICVYDKEDPKGIYKNVPRAILPVEYGGEAGSVRELTEYWKNKVENRVKWYREDDEFGVVPT